MDYHGQIYATFGAAAAISNSTEFDRDNWTSGYQTTYGRYLLIGWCALTLLISLPGNTLILVASIKYNAIRLDKVAIILIENIAVADMGVALFTILPRMASAIAAGWEYACDVSAPVTLLFSGASILMMSALNLSKLTCLLFPLRARMRTHTQGRIIAASLWVCIVLLICLLQIVTQILLGKFMGTYYDTHHYCCIIDPQPKVRLLFADVFATFIIVPIGTMAVTTIWLMVYVKKVRGISKESVVTLITISLVFFVSFIPIVIGRLFTAQIYLFGHDSYYYFEFVYGVCYLNYIANPFVYFFTVKSFNGFVVNLFRGGERGAPRPSQITA